MTCQIWEQHDNDTKMGDCGGGVSLPSSSQSVEAVIGANAWAGEVPKHASVLHAESQGLDGVANVLQLEAIRRLRGGGWGRGC